MENIWPDCPLPIDSQLDNIISQLKNNKVVICSAETGSGKSTRIAQALHLSDPNLQIVLTQPRRNAVRWTARRIASELKCKVGSLVGWKMKNDRKFSKDTKILLTVDLSFLNEVKKTGKLPPGVIIVDEAHERSIPLDILLSVIKIKLPYYPNTKLLVASATIDFQKFSKYFYDASVLQCTVQNYPVDVVPFQRLPQEHHTEGAIRCAKHVMKCFFQNDLKLSNDVRIRNGVVILLLPGIFDIRKAVDKILAYAKEQKEAVRIEAMPCSGEMSNEEQDLIHSKLPFDVLRFICGTEVLRASVTIQDTIGVIDSLEIKRMVEKNGICRLTKVAISKAQANQAKGRAGRTQPGFYMPVSWSNEYAYLEGHSIPDVLRLPLDFAALQIAAFGFSILNLDLLDQPSVENSKNALTRLRNIGAVEGTEHTITKFGEVLLKLNLTPEHGACVLRAKKFGVLPEMVVLISIIQTPSFFSNGLSNENPALDDRLQFSK
jgi:HrpA-like RNA helicase